MLDSVTFHTHRQTRQAQRLGKMDRHTDNQKNIAGGKQTEKDSQNNTERQSRIENGKNKASKRRKR